MSAATRIDTCVNGRPCKPSVQVHQAVALPGMVVATQSLPRRYASELQCNGDLVFRNLRDPLASVLRATAELVGGLVRLGGGGGAEVGPLL